MFLTDALWRTCNVERKSLYMFHTETFIIPWSPEVLHIQTILMGKTEEQYPKGSLNKQIKGELYLINSENSCFSSGICVFIWNIVFLLITQSPYHKKKTLHCIVIPLSCHIHYLLSRTFWKQNSVLLQFVVCIALLPHLSEDLEWSCEIVHVKCRSWGVLQVCPNLRTSQGEEKS